MNKISKTILSAITISILFFTLSGFQENSGETIDKKVENLISQMTLQEKVGQMTQITLQVVGKTQGSAGQKFELDEKKLEEAIVKYNIGSILNVWDVAMSVDEWQNVITKIQDIAVKKTRLKIPVIYGIDAIHGANYIKEATLFPQSIGMAAAWNLDLVKKSGEITAFEVRAAGITWNFNPVLGIGRQPLWPRLFETYGESSYAVTQFGAAYIKGIEGGDNPKIAKDKIAACMKHYLGYSAPLSGKDRTPAWIPERMLREIFLPPFKAAVDAGVHTVMINSSEINGIPVHSSHYLLTEVLRNELGFKGFAVSDWGDIEMLYKREKVAANRKEAVKMAVIAGVDMCMVPLDYSFYNELLELVKEGEVSEQRIDQAVSRILKVKFQLGLFENAYPDPHKKKKVGCDEFARLSLQAARESITLLKNNDSILPLDKDIKVLVCGPTANSRAYLNSGWTYTWQGDKEELYPKNKKTVLEAVQAKIGEKNVVYVPRTKYDSVIDITPAVEAAKKSDAAIVCLGEKAYCESLGNINDLTLPDAQLQLVKALAKTGKPIILILAEGRPRIINGIVDHAQGILMAYLPGPEGGQAIADALFGDCNPSGKLPITYPRYPNAITCYDYKYSEQVEPNKYDPQFPFGFGLSYTKFEYNDLKLDKPKLKEGQNLNISLKVKNTGKRFGKETVMLYLSDVVRSVTPPFKQLRGFKKIALKPGEQKEVTFTLTKDDLSFIGRENKRIVEAGQFIVTVGNLKQGFILE